MDNISYVGIKLYMDRQIFSDDFIYKEEGFFKPGKIVWFDAPVFPGDHFQDVEVIYSRSRDGSDSAATNRIDITKAKECVNTKLTNEFQLKLTEFK